jgi:nicotinamidase-related amidase
LRPASALSRNDSGNEEAARRGACAQGACRIFDHANSTPADVIKDVAPLAEEPHVLSGPDKFRNTDLEKILKDKGITTVIAVGTASNGAVLYTASGAAFRGMNVIIPVDGMSAVDPYAEYSTVFTFMNAPSVSAKTTLTRSDMIKF